MKNYILVTNLIFLFYTIFTIFIYSHPGTHEKSDLFLSLLHILWLNIVVILTPANSFFIVSVSTISYYIITIFDYTLQYWKHKKNNVLIYIIHHIVSILLLLKFINNESQKIQTFILQLIFLLNLSSISQLFYEFSKDLPNECRKYNLKIYFIIFFLFRIIVFPIFILASIKQISHLLTQTEKVYLSTIGVIFYAIVWKWVFELRNKIQSNIL